MRFIAAALLCLFVFPAHAFDRHAPESAWNTGISISHSRVAHSGSRPHGCPHAWCGCWLSLQKYGQNIRKLWVARNWAHEGRAAPRGCTGCVAVLTRGKRGGHVGIVQSWDGPNPVILSGNHNRRVGVGTYSARRIIALRWV